MNYSYVDTDAKLTRLVSLMKDTSCIALDTEADSLYHYYSKICLIQLSIGNDDFILDPLAIIDISSFLDVLKNKRLIIHGADFDLRMLRNQYGFLPSMPVFDTMLAAQLVGHKRASLAELIKTYLGINISKQGQKSDWSKRPLSESQLEYAVKDTRYLQELANKLEEDLDRLNRKEWHEESCGWLVKESQNDKARDLDKEWRVKGWNKLERHELIYLRELWKWRDGEARKTNLPAFKIMGNEQLIKIVQRASSKDNLKLNNLHKNRLKGIRDSIARAEMTPEDKWPEIRQKHTVKKAAAPKIKELLDETKKLAKDLNLEPSIIATRSTLEALAKSQALTAEEMTQKVSIMHWQARLLEPIVNKLYA